MPTISAIKPQKKGNRVNVYLDGKFGFGIDLQTFLKEGLKVEKELTEKEIEIIVKQGQFQSAYDKILRFASLRPRSEKEYKDWLKKHKIHESLYEELFNRLNRLELMDDKKFATWWINQRIQFRPKSKRVLVLELRNKGVKKEDIDKAFSEENLDERAAAKEILSKKKRLWEHLTGYEKRKKMFSFLMQRGFDTEVIREILGDIDEV